MHIGSNAHQAIGDMGGRGNAPDIYNIDLNDEKEQRILKKYRIFCFKRQRYALTLRLSSNRRQSIPYKIFLFVR